jgi:hypothetical protein
MFAHMLTNSLYAIKEITVPAEKKLRKSRPGSANSLPNFYTAYTFCTNKSAISVNKFDLGHARNFIHKFT